ncbi:PadR family transcriptional regulator [Paenibacillus lentus]|uniref:PadR family transcriptional regulator n=1 Tax=Paenibacillus lentus TaxID=1338368 RepID=UPI0036610EB9
MTTYSQMLKGILEGCILALMENKEIYGYELSALLEQSGLAFVSEGSIYPLLLRMQKEELIRGELRQDGISGGPPRKYYRLTDKGAEALLQFRRSWDGLRQSVDHVLSKGEMGDENQTDGRRE